MDTSSHAILTTEKAVPDKILREAQSLVELHFFKCFWFRHPDSTIHNWEDVLLVIQHLREYGGHQEWHDAQEFWKKVRACR